jgi:hypothetical protein
MVKENLFKKKNNTQFQKRAEHWKFSLNSFRNQTAKHSSSTFFVVFVLQDERENYEQGGERTNCDPRQQTALWRRQETKLRNSTDSI